MWTAFIDQLAAVLHSFRHNVVRSLLTLLGMIIGSGSVVLLSGLLAGGREALQMTEQFINDNDVIEIENTDPPPAKRGRTQRPLDLADQGELNENRLVGAGAEGELFDWNKWVYYGEKKKRISVLGTDTRALSMYRIGIAHGRFLSEEDLHEGRRVCVVGDEIWEELLGAPERLDGLAVRVSGQRWEVVGVIKHKPALVSGPGPWTWGRRIVVPSTTFQATVRHSRKVDSVYVRLVPMLGSLADRIRSAKGLIKSVVTRRHYGVENFKFGDDKNEKEQSEVIFMTINVLMLCTSALSLFVGGINIMNIMLVTVTERTREIGIRRALGATQGNILRQFLLESGIIAGLGGLCGVLGGVALVFAVSRILTSLLGQWTAHYHLWAIVAGLSSSTLTGIVFGLYPAWRAALLDPVEALRYE